MTNPVSFNLEKNPFFQNFDSREMDNNIEEIFVNEDSENSNVDRLEINQKLTDRLEQIAGNAPQNNVLPPVQPDNPPQPVQEEVPPEVSQEILQETPQPAPEPSIKVPSPEDLNVMFMGYGMQVSNNTQKPKQEDNKSKSSGNSGIFSGFQNTNYSLDTFGI